MIEDFKIKRPNLFIKDRINRFNFRFLMRSLKWMHSLVLKPTIQAISQKEATYKFEIRYLLKKTKKYRDIN